MSEQPGTSRWPVALAAMFLVLAAVAFTAAFYLLDGMRVAQPLVDQLMSLVMDSQQPPAPNPGGKPNRQLVLPAGVSEEFALRLWQEQLDSQPMIERLVSGEVRSLKIDKVVKSGTSARLLVTVKMSDGSSAPGTIGMKQMGGNWYVSYATGDRQSDTGGTANAVGTGSAAQAPLPGIDEVDQALLSTIMAEQVKSQPVIEEYLAGIVKEVLIEDVRPGPRTVTLSVEMDETHPDGYAQLVAIRDGVDESGAWFLARFTKTGDATQTAK